ncbi:hypothetical protein [Xanthomonas arboricola]|uniref:hypothetical protein n=1 Tax=Xanthomonas arboricola TaxID=56448 RepID=UPI0011B0EC78|nr:hypothetical protein [Xanthomonas arboricola]
MEISGKTTIVPVGAQFANVGVAANVVTQIVSPATNQYGIVIRTCSLSGASSAIGLAVYADTSAPSGYGDGTKRVIFLGVAPPSDHFPYQVYLPPGYGVWLVTNGNGSINMTYDVLDRLPTGL